MRCTTREEATNPNNNNAPQLVYPALSPPRQALWWSNPNLGPDDSTTKLSIVDSPHCRPLSTSAARTYIKLAKMTAAHDSILESFPNIPPFPTDVPTVPLLRISLSKLRAGDKEESARLFSASKALGFFYLDLRADGKGEQILEEADELFQVGEELFEAGREQLAKYDYSAQGSYFGYKGYGTAYVDERGSLDRNEFYNVRGSPPAPAPVQALSISSTCSHAALPLHRPAKTIS